MEDSYRAVALFGIAISVLSIPFGYFNIYAEDALVFFCLGFVYLFSSWYLKSPTSPPSSLGYWLAVGDPPEYTEMSTRQLYFQIKWLRFEQRSKTSAVRPVEKVLGLTLFEKYDADQIETELTEAVTELRQREDDLAIRLQAKWNIEMTT